MNEDPNRIRLVDFNSLVHKLNILKPSLAVVFGSYLLNPQTARDLDILLVSEFFENTYYQHRSKLLPTKHHRKPIDSFCFTPDEFRSLFKPDQPFIKAIKNNHLELIGAFEEYY